MDVAFSFEAVTSPVQVRRARISCVLGRPLCADLEIASAEPIEPETLVGTRGRVDVGDASHSGMHQGIVTSIIAIATSLASAERRYRVELRSPLEVLRIRRDARIFARRTQSPS